MCGKSQSRLTFDSLNVLPWISESPTESSLFAKQWHHRIDRLFGCGPNACLSSSDRCHYDWMTGYRTCNERMREAAVIVKLLSLLQNETSSVSQTFWVSLHWRTGLNLCFECVLCYSITLFLVKLDCAAFFRAQENGNTSRTEIIRRPFHVAGLVSSLVWWPRNEENSAEFTHFMCY